MQKNNPQMNYYNFGFLIRANNRPISINVVAISIESASADVRQAYGEDVEIITISCNYS